MPEDPRFLYQVERIAPETFAGVVYERIEMSGPSMGGQKGLIELVPRATAVSGSEQKVRSMLKRKLRKQG